MREPDSDAGEAVVLYDSDCGFCKWSLNKILAWDRDRRLRPVAIQSEEGQRLLAPVPAERRLDSWHLALPGGRVESAGAGAPPLARRLPGGRPLALLFERFPRATERAYRAVAGRRATWARLLRIDSSCELRR
ncbi:MAG TPA: DCC1-like thiol-disulfide oxidoreductase family protein [Solirubrobacterales bacterium]|nr:DCC1-like thiol-disulfide oxidoreductase family protein [Solirubrobacterales bacterium]